jgi:phenylalanyl-tRNA synthetase beta chain
MKVPLNWLKQFVELPDSVTELTDKLTAIGHMQDKKPEKMGDDTVIDLEVRQNRSDCYSILGIAREVAAVTGGALKFQMPSAKSKINEDKAQLIISNTDPTLCLRFCAVRIRLTSQNSQLQTPSWMKAHLEAYGIKVISPIVDVTNYVMIETGEPMHAFDIRQVQDAHITIRRAKKDEKLTVLGGCDLSLVTDDLVIADEKKILSFSGLIGAEGTGKQRVDLPV